MYRTPRKLYDAYPTPVGAVFQLVEALEFELRGTCLECCAGNGSIATTLDNTTSLEVSTNDIDPLYGTSYNLDATLQDSWDQLPEFDWVITNPPYNVAPAIVPKAFQKARIGIIMLLRISYLEPALNRGTWLALHPPDKIISIPRISFTEDRKTDTASTPWYLWLKNQEGLLQQKITKPIVVIPRSSK